MNERRQQVRAASETAFSQMQTSVIFLYARWSEHPRQRRLVLIANLAEQQLLSTDVDKSLQHKTFAGNGMHETFVAADRVFLRIRKVKSNLQPASVGRTLLLERHRGCTC